MKRNVSLAILAGTAIAAAAFGIGVAVGQQTPPSANQGVTVGPATFLDLPQELDSLDGRQLRLRIVTIEPGGVVANHSHKGRPTVAHLVSGVLTERREGDWVKVHQAGRELDRRQGRHPLGGEQGHRADGGRGGGRVQALRTFRR